NLLPQEVLEDFDDFGGARYHVFRSRIDEARHNLRPHLLGVVFSCFLVTLVERMTQRLAEFLADGVHERCIWYGRDKFAVGPACRCISSCHSASSTMNG